MIKFDLIGSLDLRRDDGKEIDQLLRQPKRLALLAYLATPAPGTWHRRDTLLGLFWPELDSARARTALRNALYVLRQSLGEGVVTTRGDEEVCLDPASIATDLDAAYRAIRDGRAEEALALYRGELLPGLYPGETETFNEWLDSQRARLRTDVARAGAAHVEQLERERRLPDALRVAKRILEITPDDETAVRRVLALHDAIGDRGGGLAAYERFAAWLRDEFEAEPSKETLEVVDRLRRVSVAPPRSATAPTRVNSAPVSRDEVPPKRPRRTTIATAIVLVAIVLMGSFASVYLRSPAVRIGTKSFVTNDDGLQIQPAISPDGKLVAYTKGTAGHMRIYVKSLESGATWTLTNDSSATELVPRWSPDSKQILYLANESAWVTTAGPGGVPRKVVEGANLDESIHSVSWSVGGDSALYVRNDSLMVQRLDGPGSRFIGKANQLHGCTWSPGGNWIACVSGNWISFVPGPLFLNRAPSQILLFRATGGPPIALTDSTHMNGSPAWSPDGQDLWFVSNLDGPDLEVYAMTVGSDGRPVRAPEKIGLTTQWISRTETRIAYTDYDRWSNVWSLPLPKGNELLNADAATQITTGRHIIEIVTVSPGGKWLVFDMNEHNNSDIYRVPIANPSAAAERLTTDSTDDFVGAVSHNEQFLLWHTFAGMRRQVRVKRLADGKIEIPFEGFKRGQGSARWSPNDSAVAAWENDGKGGVLFTARRDTSGRWLPPAWELRGQLPVWSPKGDTLAFVTLEGNIETIPADSGPTHVLYEPRKGTEDPIATNVLWIEGSAPRWFIGNTPMGVGGIWELPANGRRPRMVVALTTQRVTGYGPAIDTDGKNLYFVLEERHGNVRYAELVKR